MQTYFFGKSVEVPRIIFKARGTCLDIKMQQRWKDDEVLCVGCKSNEETGEEILQWNEFGEIKPGFIYELFFFLNEGKQIF